MTMNTLQITPGDMTLAQWRQVYQAPVTLTLDTRANEAMDQSVNCVNKVLAEDRTVYGINTGFGLLAQTRIEPGDLESLQQSLVRSHAAGVGDALDDGLVRLIMALNEGLALLNGTQVSMAPNAGRRLWAMADNTRQVLAIEWLAACQGLDFREGLKTTEALEQARGWLRERVTYYDKDRYFAQDIKAANRLLATRCLNALVPDNLFAQGV